MIPPQKHMTGMLGHPVAENPIDRMFDAVYAHNGLNWQFWKNDIASEKDLAVVVPALQPLGYSGFAITVPYKVAVIPFLDEVDSDVKAIGAANYVTIENGRLIGHNNDGKGVVKAIEKVVPLRGQNVVMLGAGGAGRAMAVEIAWAGAAKMTIVTRREEQGRGVAALVTKASGIPCAWQAWQREVEVPTGTTLLMNATHLGLAVLVFHEDHLIAGFLTDILLLRRAEPHRQRAAGHIVVDILIGHICSPSFMASSMRCFQKDLQLP